MHLNITQKHARASMRVQLPYLFAILLKNDISIGRNHYPTQGMLPPKQITITNATANTYRVSKDDIVNKYQEIVDTMAQIQETIKRMTDKVTDETSDTLKEEVMMLICDNDIRCNLKIMKEYEQVVNKLFD